MSTTRFLLALLAGTILILVAHMFDHLAWEHWRYQSVNERDWGRMLRSMGYLPVWLTVAIGYWANDLTRSSTRRSGLTRRAVGSRDVASDGVDLSGTVQGGSGSGRPGPGEPGKSPWGWRRGALVLLSPVVAGLLAELGKLLVRRLRPDPELYGYVFRAFSDAPFSTRGLGMPSSHVAVAFGAAFALSRLIPRAWPLWYLLAFGCAVTRVLALGHFLSDTVAALVVAWFVVELLSAALLGPSKQKGC